MPAFAFRNLAQQGILTDPNPYELPPNAWSSGVNVRFAAGRAMRAPVWRLVEDSLPMTPIFGAAYRPSTGNDSVFVVGNDGQIFQYQNQTVTNVSPSGFTPAAQPPSYSSCFLGGVQYINTPTGVPLYFAPGSTTFQAMSAWDATWSCRTLRTFGDYLIALNVTKGTTSYPTMFKWSDTVLVGGPPGSWDSTNAATNAGENVLEDMTSPIVDGLSLRSAFVVYSSNQVWLVQQTGNALDFQFSQAFSDGGLIAPNCVVEVDGRHYVFGAYDIYMHDGITKQSLVENRVKEYIFSNLNDVYSSLFFVTHMPETNEIMFAFVSGDADVAFQTTIGCNRGAVFNYAQNTWSFRDLPNLVSMGNAAFATPVTWGSMSPSVTWGNMGGTWYSLSDPYRVQSFGVSAALAGSITNSRLLLYDFMNKGTAPFGFIAECNTPAYVQRIGIDLDQFTNDQPSNLTLYKVCKRIYPQVSMFGNVPAQVSVGSQVYPSGPVTWLGPFNFDPTQDYKIDLRQGGRYLAFRIAETSPADFEVSGFDADIVTKGSR